ncbi:DCC1-like thiol-disulfide oxidoreductase family protein [Patulibacter defluvii]|uniref:DCC1-like thiol-disulfide oxidoreductase family protein n=1 Tax=Patulibacter defluvii TaxID=3095358 RepID=UPI002A752FA0|nr:DCC1-like thiol-disulfide oxidoreductase family protein [Patulibacter sp. DM4]
MSTPPEPSALRPGDPPGRGERLLVLFDANCGFCLSGRDLLRRWDRRGRLADDLIQRHQQGLLADLSPEAQLATWHVIHPDGRRESGGAALAAVLHELPGAAPGSWIARHLPGPTDRAYRWMAGHRIAISRLLRTQGHPERGRIPD